MRLTEMVESVQYSVVEEGEQQHSSLIKTWLALLLGDFSLEQHGDFYDSSGIRVSLQKTI